MAEEYLQFDDLAAFAKSEGKGHVANGLWRLIELYLHEPIADKGFLGLELRSVETKERVTDLVPGHVEVSVASLKAARGVIQEQMIDGYGRRTHELFCAWVDSLR